jgi:hypothetical protein
MRFTRFFNHGSFSLPPSGIADKLPMYCMQPPDQILAERLFLPSPFLHAQESVPVVSYLGDVPFPAGDLGMLVGYYHPGLLQSEAVALDEGGIVRRTHPSPGSKLDLRRRRKGDVIHQGAGCLDLHQAAGDCGGEGKAWGPGGWGHLFHSKLLAFIIGIYYVKNQPVASACDQVFRMILRCTTRSIA